MSVNTDNNTVQAPTGQLKQVELKPGATFVANGKNYYVSSSFPIGRFSKVNQLEEELSQFSDMDSCHKVMMEAMKCINDYRPGEAYTLMYNKLDSDKKNVHMLHYTLRMCAAYINYEGEDITYLTDETIQTKINDWSAEGFDVVPFYNFATKAFRELYQSFRSDTLSILTEAKSIKETLLQEQGISSLTENPKAGQE